MKIKNHIGINGQIRVLTGLHIGGSVDVMEIGGNDNPVIKNPITGDPYIPGSSLKGKMRMLLEWYLNLVDDNGNVHECDEINCPVCRIFGVSSNKNIGNRGPSRLLVRDSTLDGNWKKSISEQGLLITETKTENTINRITASANPRPMERVPKGAIFNFEMVYRVFDMGDEGKNDEKFLSYVFYALKLAELDYLGGSGSRGSGKVKFENLKKIIDGKVENVELPDFLEVKSHLTK